MIQRGKTMMLFLLLVITVILFAGCDTTKKSYEETLSLFNNGDYEEALTNFEALGDYKDALTKAEEAREMLVFPFTYKNSTLIGYYIESDSQYLLNESGIGVTTICLVGAGVNDMDSLEDISNEIEALA